MYQKPEKIHECSKCRHKYGSRDGMNRHFKQCTVIPTADATINHPTIQNNTIDNSNNNIVNNNIENLNQTLNQTIIVNQTVINKYVNPIIVNNNLDLLNEKCGTAMNLVDVLKSLPVTPEFYQKFAHWDFKKCNEALFTLLEDHISELPITQRPLHSSKQPNEKDQVMYVRNDDKWTDEQELEWSYAFTCTDEDVQTHRKSVLNGSFTEFINKITDEFEEKKKTDYKKLTDGERISRNLTARLGPDTMVAMMLLLAKTFTIDELART